MPGFAQALLWHTLRTPISSTCPYEQREQGKEEAIGSLQPLRGQSQGAEGSRMPEAPWLISAAH